MPRPTIRDDVRRADRERLHSKGAVCVLCGKAELECLIQTSRRLVEQHHVLGRNHDSRVTVPLCRNCHAEVHEAMLRKGVDLRKQPTFEERLPEMLRALAVFLEFQSQALIAWAAQVERTPTSTDSPSNEEDKE